MQLTIYQTALKVLRAKLVTQNAFPSNGHSRARYDPVGGYTRQFDGLETVLELSWREAAHAHVDPRYLALFDRIQSDEVSLVCIYGC
jgi:hypothetical protein